MDIKATTDAADDLAFRVAIRQSEIRYRRLFEAAHDGVLILNSVSLKITDANPFMSQLLGYQHEELLGKELWEIGLLRDEQASQAVFRELQKNCKVRYEDLPLKSKSGERREVEIVANRYDEDGTQVVQCNVRDITERKRTEGALRASEERFRTLFDLVPSAVYSCDAQGIIQDFNRRATELWGRTPVRGDDSERFCGSIRMFRPDGSFMPHDQCPMAWVSSGKVSEVNDEEVIIERPDGSRVTAIVNIRPLMNERGEITGAINCAYDITERKHVEEHQHFLMGELAHRGGNLLAVIQSIVARTLIGAKPLTEERATLTRRLQALARSQSALMSKGFQGALLAEIIQLEFEGFSDRIEAHGPDVMLNSRADLCSPPARARHQCRQIRCSIAAGQRPDRYQLVGRGRSRRSQIQISMAGMQRTFGRATDSQGLRQCPARKNCFAGFWRATKDHVRARWIALFDRRRAGDHDSWKSANKSPAFK